MDLLRLLDGLGRGELGEEAVDHAALQLLVGPAECAYIDSASTRAGAGRAVMIRTFLRLVIGLVVVALVAPATLSGKMRRSGAGSCGYE